MSRSKSSERAATIPQLVGFHPEKLSAENLEPFDVPRDTPATSTAPTNAKEIVKALGRECGYEPNEGVLGTLEQGLTQHKKARTMDTVGLAKEKAVREVKSVGELAPSKETLVPIDQSVANETSKLTKVRNQSTERASLHARAEGFVADEETPKMFDDKFEVKTSNALESRLKEVTTDRAKMMTRSEGLAVHEEETKDYAATSPKTEQSKATSEKTKASEKATKHSKQLGSLGDEDTAGVLKIERPKQEKPLFKPVSNNRSLAMLEGRAEGFEADEEMPEQFVDKMRIKSEVAKESKTEGQANASILQQDP